MISRVRKVKWGFVHWIIGFDVIVQEDTREIRMRNKGWYFGMFDRGIIGGRVRELGWCRLEFNVNVEQFYTIYTGMHRKLELDFWHFNNNTRFEARNYEESTKIYLFKNKDLTKSLKVMLKLDTMLNSFVQYIYIGICEKLWMKEVMQRVALG